MDHLPTLSNLNGITVAELKRFIQNWPEVDKYGEPTEVWLETGANLSSPCIEILPLNHRIGDDGNPTSDLVFEAHPSVWEPKVKHSQN